MRSPISLRTAIIQLQNRSLIASQSHTPLTTLRIHDLIQVIVLENTKKDGTEQEWFQCAVEIACGAFGQIEDLSSPKCWLQCESRPPVSLRRISTVEVALKRRRSCMEMCWRTRSTYLDLRIRIPSMQRMIMHGPICIVVASMMRGYC